MNLYYEKTNFFFCRVTCVGTSWCLFKCLGLDAVRKSLFIHDERSFRDQARNEPMHKNKLCQQQQQQQLQPHHVRLAWNDNWVELLSAFQFTRQAEGCTRRSRTPKKETYGKPSAIMKLSSGNRLENQQPHTILHAHPPATTRRLSRPHLYSFAIGWKDFSWWRMAQDALTWEQINLPTRLCETKVWAECSK